MHPSFSLACARFDSGPTPPPTHGVSQANKNRRRRHGALESLKNCNARCRVSFPLPLRPIEEKNENEKKKNLLLLHPFLLFALLQFSDIQVFFFHYSFACYASLIQLLRSRTRMQKQRQEPKLPHLLRLRLLPPPLRSPLPQPQQQQQRGTSCSPRPRPPAAPGQTARTGSASRPRRRGFSEQSRSRGCRCCFFLKFLGFSFVC